MDFVLAAEGEAGGRPRAKGVCVERGVVGSGILDWVGESRVGISFVGAGFCGVGGRCGGCSRVVCGYCGGKKMEVGVGDRNVNLGDGVWKGYDVADGHCGGRLRVMESAAEEEQGEEIGVKMFLFGINLH